MPDTTLPANPYTDDAYASFTDSVDVSAPLAATDRPTFDAYAAFSDVAEL